VEGPDAIVELTEPLPAGTHTIQWRVGSSVRHPIEGALTITLEPDSEDSASEGGVAVGDQQASDRWGEQGEEPAASFEVRQADEGSETVSEDEADESGSGTLPLLLSVIGVAVVGAAVAAFFVLRRKQ